MKIIIVGGFLGCGKTTLINDWLSNLSAERVAVIENESGAVNLDADRLRGKAGSVYDIHSGCICCDRNEALADVLLAVAREGKELVIIEPTGVADIGALKRFIPDRYFLRTVTLIDASNYEKYRRNFGDFYEKQIADADLVYTNRGTIDGYPEGMPALEEVWETGISHHHTPDSKKPNLCLKTIRNLSFASQEAFSQYLKGIEETSGIVRAKGEIMLSGEPARFEYTGGRLALGPSLSDVCAAVFFTEKPL